MEECECSTVQVDYQTEELYIVTIVLKYQKRGSNNNNNVLHILLSGTVVLSTGTPWDLMWNREALVCGVMGDWNEV